MPRKAEKPPAEKVAHQVATAFSDAQKTNAAHPRATKLLLSAFKIAPKPFLVSFTHAINRILLVFSRDPSIERLVTFVANFAATNNHHTGNFCSLVLTYLISHANATGRSVRFRTTQLIASVLHQLPEDAEISDDVWFPLQTATVHQSFDKVPRVRAAAAGALCRLQTSADADDPFCKRLVDMLTADSSSAVRKAALQAIAVNEYTMPFVAGRTRDVNVEVRKAAYETLARKVNPFQLHPEERISILVHGLGERLPAAKEVCEQKLLVEGWLEGACEGNVFGLIELLGCPDYEDEILRALRVVFQSERSKELVKAIEIDINNMTGPDVLLLRAMSDCKHGEESIEKFLSTTSLYAEVVRYYAVSDFASRHLLELCTSVDMSDEVGRKAVEEVIRNNFLCSNQVSEETVGSAVRALRRVMKDGEATSRLMLEIVQDILQEDTSEETEEKPEAVAQEPRNQNWRQVRTLNICLEVLRITKQGVSSASPLNSICQNLMAAAVLPQLMSDDEQKRLTAVECLGLFCLIDGSGAEARTHAPLFLQATKTDIPAIQELALTCLVDFLMVFDFTDHEAPSTQMKDSPPDASNGSENGIEEEYESNNPVTKENIGFSSLAEECISNLSQNITNADGMIRTIAVEGLARLLFVGRIAPNATLISRLLIVQHNPSTEDDASLRQCLSVFFPAFAMFSPQHRLGIEEAFRPTCRTIASAPNKSPLSTISLVQVAQFILHLTNPAMVPAKKERNIGGITGKSADQIHERLAEVVLNEIIDACNDDEIDLCRTYGKVLSNFRFRQSSGNIEELGRLKKLAKTAWQNSDDKRMRTLLQKFCDRVDVLFDNAKVNAPTIVEATKEEPKFLKETAESEEKTSRKSTVNSKIVKEEADEQKVESVLSVADDDIPDDKSDETEVLRADRSISDEDEYSPGEEYTLEEGRAKYKENVASSPLAESIITVEDAVEESSSKHAPVSRKAVKTRTSLRPRRARRTPLIEISDDDE